MRNLSLQQTQEVREKKKILIPNDQEQLIIQRFNQSIEKIKQKDEVIKLLSNHQQSTLDIRQSQIILLMSALDFYIHEIVKYSFIQKFNGLQPKTIAYYDLLIPMKLVEAAIKQPESLDWLDEAITTMNQYKNFTSYEKIKSQLISIGLSKAKIKQLVSTVEDKVGIENPIDKIRLIRNQLAHQELQTIEVLESELTEEKIKPYIEFIHQFVQQIHKAIRELDN